MLAALLLAAVVMFDVRILNDGDTYWHVATGDWILSHARVPRVDVFSYSRSGSPWVTQEWLSEVLMALAWRTGGWTGVVILFAAAIAMAAWLLVRRLSAALGGFTLVLVSVLIFGCMSGSLLARPHLLALPILIVWTVALLTARREHRAPSLVLAPLMAVWANMHGSYLLGILLAGAFGLEALAETKQDRGKVIRDWGLFGVAILCAALITPHGLDGFTYPFQIMSMTSLPGIVEWRAADFTKPSVFELALLVTLFVCLRRDVKVPVVRLLILLGLLHLALQHTRHQLVLAAVAPLLLAEPLAMALGQTPVRPRLRVATLTTAVGLGIVLLGLRLTYPVVRVDGFNSPVSAIAQLPSDLKRRPVMNEYGFGGYLIYKGIRPFIDGRSDMYGDAFTRAYFALDNANQAALDRFLNYNGVDWTIFAPQNPLVAVLDRDPSWKRIYADRHAVVHRRMPLNVALTTPQT